VGGESESEVSQPGDVRSLAVQLERKLALHAQADDPVARHAQSLLIYQERRFHWTAADLSTRIVERGDAGLTLPGEHAGAEGVTEQADAGSQLGFAHPLGSVGERQTR